MCSRFFVVTALLFALLPAQELTSTQLKFGLIMDEALGVHPGVVIADIGTGTSPMNAIRIAEKAGANGRVVCVDVKPTVIASIEKQIAAQQITNITAVLGKEDNPLLTPGAFDGILVSNTYHEFTDPSAMLRNIAEALKSDGKLVVAELYSNAHKGESRAEQGKYHDMSPDILERELIAAGFVIKGRSIPIRIDTDRFRYLLTAEYGDKLKRVPHLTN